MERTGSRPSTGVRSWMGDRLGIPVIGFHFHSFRNSFRFLQPTLHAIKLLFPSKNNYRGHKVLFIIVFEIRSRHKHKKSIRHSVLHNGKGFFNLEGFSLVLVMHVETLMKHIIQDISIKTST